MSFWDRELELLKPGVQLKVEGEETFVAVKRDVGVPTEYFRVPNPDMTQDVLEAAIDVFNATRMLGGGGGGVPAEGLEKAKALLSTLNSHTAISNLNLNPNKPVPLFVPIVNTLL